MATPIVAPGGAYTPAKGITNRRDICDEAQSRRLAAHREWLRQGVRHG